MSHRATVARFKRVVRRGTIYSRPARKGWRPSWVWQAVSWLDVAHCLHLLQPYLHTKRAESKLLLRIVDWHCERASSRVYSRRERILLQAAETRLKALKRRPA